MPSLLARWTLLMVSLSFGGASAQKLNITTNSLPPGTAGTSYNQTLSAKGGRQPYTWSLTGGSLPAGIQLSASGGISGTPAAPGKFSFTVQVADSTGSTDRQDLQITINPATLQITSSSLPAGTVGTPYSQQLSASGGTPPYSWSVASGSLPNGISLGSSGFISGTPTAAGTFSFTVGAADSGSKTATQGLSITVQAAPPLPLTITTASLPNGMVGAAYSQTLAASGGAGGYTWSIAGGSLPAGMNLAASGAISGTPTAAGNSSFTVQVADSSHATAAKTLTLTVTPAGISITTGSLPNGTVGAAYSQMLAATGGTGGYTWSIVSGSLPAGVSLSANGAISGTPTAVGNSAFTVQVADNSATSAAKALTLTINPPALSIVSGSLPAGTLGVPYSQTLSATGGAGGYTWSVTGGSLPPGISLAPSGVISGTPSTSGNYSFTAKVIDGAGASQSASLSLAIMSTLTIVTPPVLNSGSAGTPYNQTLFATGGAPPYTWTLMSGSLPSGLTLDPGNGSIGGTPTQVGTFQFRVQVSSSASTPAHQDFTIVIASGLTIATPPVLPAAAIGVHYTLLLQPAGGKPPYVWSITKGTLPAGLGFSAGGQIDGTPTAAGSFAFTAALTDGNTNQASKDFTLTVAQALTITTAPTLPSGIIGSPYSQPLAASGGSPPYQWSITDGAVPPGIALDGSAGSLTGTPTTAGTFAFTATVIDSASVTAQKQFSVVVGRGISLGSPAALPGATAGTAYSFTLSASGGAGPYSWTLTGGGLPPGLALNASSGVISGTPTAGGTFNFTIQVTDTTGLLGSGVETIVVTLPALPALTIAGPPDTVAPLQQPAIDISLAAPYPVDLTGVVTLSFIPGGANPVDDPGVQFSTGGRSARFTIPANTAHATFPNSPFALQTGSVAGTIQLEVDSLQAGGATLSVAPGSRQVQVAPAAPIVQNLSVVHTSGGFNLQFTAVSNTRDLTQAVVLFHAATGSALSTPQVTVPLNSVAQNWFQGTPSAAFGGQFGLMLPFTVEGAVSLDSVSVILSNSVGDSQAATASF